MPKNEDSFTNDFLSMCGELSKSDDRTILKDLSRMKIAIRHMMVKPDCVENKTLLAFQATVDELVEARKFYRIEMDEHVVKELLPTFKEQAKKVSEDPNLQSLKDNKKRGKIVKQKKEPSVLTTPKRFHKACQELAYYDTVKVSLYDSIRNRHIKEIDYLLASNSGSANNDSYIALRELKTALQGNPLQLNDVKSAAEKIADNRDKFLAEVKMPEQTASKALESKVKAAKPKGKKKKTKKKTGWFSRRSKQP